MSERPIIAASLGRIAAEFRKEPGYYSREEHLKVEVAECILHAWRLGQMTEIIGINDAISAYRIRVAKIKPEGRVTWTRADIPLIEFFDRVVGYDRATMRVGIIKSAADFLPPSVYQFTYAEDAARAWAAACEFLALLCTTPPVDPVLTDNDRCILQAMWELNAISTNVQTGSQIMKKAGLDSEPNHAFDSLKDHGLVTSKQGVGRYLTDRGRELAQRLFLERN